MGCIWESQIHSARTIYEALMKTNGSSLNYENLRTLITQAEAIINSRPLTIETLSDVNTEMHISPSQLLSMKTDFILAPPGTLSRPNRYLFHKKMATCSANGWQMLDSKEDIIPPKITSKAEVEQSKVKLQSW